MDHDIRVKTYSPARSTGEARRRAALMLVGATGISSVFVAIIFLAVLKGEWMTGIFTAVAHFMFGKPVWAIVAATSPLAAALLVGYGYMQRAIRRRGTAREAALSASQRSRPV
jgi:hypothetical protein